MLRLLDELHNLFLRQNRNTNLAIIFGLVILLGWLDYVTGFEISFSFFYLVPISLATWYINIKFGHLITTISIAVWLISNWLAGDTYSHEIIRFWNAFLRFSLFYMIATLLEQFKVVIQKERQLARTDPLTGITNRREFYIQAELEIKRASRYKHPLSIAYLDLDHFKKVNDEKGHMEGDKLLQVITQAISSDIRKTDIFARLGGDEFVLLLPNTNQISVRVVLGKIETSVTEKMKAIESPVTMSTGVITFLSAPGSVDELLHKADGLMYQAKASGKSRTIYFLVD